MCLHTEKLLHTESFYTWEPFTNRSYFKEKLFAQSPLWHWMATECTKYFQVLLGTTKLAQMTSQYTRHAQSMSQYYYIHIGILCFDNLHMFTFHLGQFAKRFSLRISSGSLSCILEDLCWLAVGPTVMWRCRIEACLYIMPCFDTGQWVFLGLYWSKIIIWLVKATKQ